MLFNTKEYLQSIQFRTINKFGEKHNSIYLEIGKIPSGIAQQDLNKF